jgi:hypothetical protein
MREAAGRLSISGPTYAKAKEYGMCRSVGRISRMMGRRPATDDAINPPPL